MGVVLYREGNDHIVNGWECEFNIFDPEILNLEARIAQGWHLSPDCGRKKENGVQVEKQNGNEERKEPQETPKLSKTERKIALIEKMRSLDYAKLKSFAKRNNVNSHNSKRKPLELLLFRELGGRDDIQD